MAETLSEILERCRAGDADAVSNLVHRFRAWALNFANALVHDPALAEDVVQESLIAALHGLGGLREGDAFPGWFRQILRRRAIRATAKRDNAVPFDATQMKSPALGPGELLDREELRDIVQKALARLPGGQRDVVVRFYIDQQRCTEIAQALALPPGTVRRRLFDARARLRDMLLGYIEDGSNVPETKPPPPRLPI